MPSPDASRANSASAGRARNWPAAIDALRTKLAAWLSSPGRAARLSDEELEDIVYEAHRLGAAARWEIERREAARDAAENTEAARKTLNDEN